MQVGREATSARLPEGLRHGAVLEEKELANDRLRFRKLHGAGPLTGWASIGYHEACELQIRRLPPLADNEVSSTSRTSVPSVAAPPGVANETNATPLRDTGSESVNTTWRMVVPRRPATLAQWYNEAQEEEPIVDSGVTRKKWSNDGEVWHDVEEAWVVRRRRIQAQVWDLNEMDILSDVALESVDTAAAQAVATQVTRPPRRNPRSTSGCCVRCPGCVRPPGHSDNCLDAAGQDLKPLPKAPQAGVYVGLAKDLTCPGDDVTYEFTLRRCGTCLLSCVPKLSLFAGGCPPWSCAGVWSFGDETVTVYVTKPDFKGPKEDDEVHMAVAMDGSSVTFKGTVCTWQRHAPLPDDFDLSGWWRLTPVEDGDIVNFMFYHEPKSKIFTGRQRDFAEIRDGCLNGELIEWRVDVFRITGRIEAEGHRLVDLEVRSDLDPDFVAVYIGEREQEPAQGLCAVCISDFQCGEDIRNLPCQHRFHTACVEQWLAISDHCPICRCLVNA